MADYFSPTVIQPAIPVASMTPLERLLLIQVFQTEPQGDNLYFFADEKPASMLWLDRGPVEAAFASSEAPAENWANCAIRQQLTALPPDNVEIEFPISNGWQYILQDIVRRSPTLPYVTVVSSFTCSTMQPDGFGGEAVLITADYVLSKSTDNIITDFLTEIDPATAAARPLELIRTSRQFPYQK